ncbi:unnamed protein product [Pseudo-nitzschia multistriata]|uniref:Uncharacterized protein n=1 Tax=Pseudo-nitzschia multistriata TaxID=183589 RepID=A0A448YY90_9STRA|nr:unnamed protein product [Pseudo-nitzschia multistriata]
MGPLALPRFLLRRPISVLKSTIPFRSTRTVKESFTTMVPTVGGMSASGGLMSTFEPFPSVMISSVCARAASACFSSVILMKKWVRFFGAILYEERSDRHAATMSNVRVMDASTASSLNESFTTGNSDNMMDGFSESPSVPRPGRRCQSSSVMKGIMQWSPRNWVSSATHNVA